MEKEKTEDIGFMETARLCMNTLFEKYFSGDCGDNVLFMVFTDGKKWDATIAGNAVNTVQLLTECCNDNPDILKVVNKVSQDLAIKRLTDTMKRFNNMFDKGSNQ